MAVFRDDSQIVEKMSPRVTIF